MERIGAEFGACLNAYTSTDETVFQFVVPVDKNNGVELLDECLAVFAEFASCIRYLYRKGHDEEQTRGIGCIGCTGFRGHAKEQGGKNRYSWYHCGGGILWCVHECSSGFMHIFILGGADKPFTSDILERGS